MKRPRARFTAFAAVLLFGQLVALLFAAGLATPVEAACPDRPPCKGCGCRGGTGYRAPDGRCVGFRELARVCGAPPSRCVFENAPGTGANRDCALAPRSGPASAAPARPPPVEPDE